MTPFDLPINIERKYPNYKGGKGEGGCKKNLGKKIGTLKTEGGKKIDPLARIYTPADTIKTR